MRMPPNAHQPPIKLQAKMASTPYPHCGYSYIKSSIIALPLLALCALLTAGAAHAQNRAPAAPDLGAVTQQWLDAAVQQAPAGSMALRMEVSVGNLDPRLKLAPCTQVEPYLPPGTRLWGRTRIGLRCVDGAARWNVFLPITVKAYGPGWVINTPVAMGATLNEGDAVEAEVDWAAEPAAILAQPQAWVGQAAARPLLVGQALRQNLVRPPQMFKSGAAVRVQIMGPGYAVTASGQALGPGLIGQSARIRMDNGRIINGTVAQDGSVEVAL